MSAASQTRQACLLLGSNIDPEVNIPRAVALLNLRLEVEDVSQVWFSPAVSSHGPDFLNAAVLVRTDLQPGALKQQVLRAVEDRLGRVRSADKYAPRPIDIDIVAWDCQVTDPDVWAYAHAALPVSEVLPCEAVSAAGEPLAQVARRLLEATPIRLYPARLAKPTAH
jgi:2-amino-4-hydroxy-6-hydroxymethyldihydropteridine diphosphokinase